MAWSRAVKEAKYREPMQLETGEVPPDLLSRLEKSPQSPLSPPQGVDDHSQGDYLSERNPSGLGAQDWARRRLSTSKSGSPYVPSAVRGMVWASGLMLGEGRVPAMNGAKHFQKMIDRRNPAS